MKKGAIVVADFYKNNRLFDLADKIANRDDSLYPYYVLKENLLKAGIELATQDVYPSAEYDFFIFLEFPLKGNREMLKSAKRKYLVIGESGLILPQNWKKENHKHFDKIFTWNDAWADNKKYIKYYWPIRIPEKLNFNLTGKRKLCCMIAGNKNNCGKNELYSERVRAIRWFEKYHPEDFDLYGIGWKNYPVSNSFISRMTRRSGLLDKLLAPVYPSYKGKAASKNETLSGYKFAICYENVKELPGYITEKIFDCFFAGCVPIYLGASNIRDFIPENTFIDKYKFRSYEDLYVYLNGMDKKTYASYLENIEKYIKSEKIKIFSADNFARTVVNNIVK